ncbi:uncharacterized protein LOC128963816 [Oppia nitens]|uniref:uncharacterized protein LOC128963816 n=1 Tax=Oppia nitens TaxID=1686743 RepID=UPI0023DCD0A1|nr:uncharacterized protein LOC128963816 [Oppia nitens]
MTPKNDSFDRFGDDLAELLFKYMPIEDKLRLQSVSKQWLQLLFIGQTYLIFGDSFYKTFNFTERRRNEIFMIFESIFKKCPKIDRLVVGRQSVYNQYIRLDEIFDQFFDLLIIYCPRLRHIIIEYIPPRGSFLAEVTDKTIERFVAAYGQQLLTFKFITDCSTQLMFSDKFLPHLHQFKCLKYYGSQLTINELFDYQQQDVFRGIVVLPTSLQSICIELTANCLPMFASFAINYGHQLKALDIIRCDLRDETPVEQTFVTTLLKFCQLRRLRIHVRFDHFNQLIDELLRQHFSRRCHQLRRLYLTGDSYNNINRESINQLIDILGKDLKQLKRLAIHCFAENELSNYKTILNSDSLKNMKQLTHLSLHFLSKFCGDEIFRDIDSRLPRLEFIDINNPIITRESMQSMSRLRHLNCVRLAGCHNPDIDDNYSMDDLISALSMVTNVYISFSKNTKYVIKVIYQRIAYISVKTINY